MKRVHQRTSGGSDGGRAWFSPHTQAMNADLREGQALMEAPHKNRTMASRTRDLIKVESQSRDVVPDRSLVQGLKDTRRLSAGVCSGPSAPTTLQVYHATPLKNAVACANHYTSRPYRIELVQDVVVSAAWPWPWPSSSGGTIFTNAIVIDSNAKVSIVGRRPGAPYTRISRSSSSLSFRIFYIFPSANVDLENLYITGGYHYTQGARGGAIWNRGVLSMKDSHVVSNRVYSTVASYASYGGGIYNDVGASIHLERCTLSGNSASAAAAGLFSIRYSYGGALGNFGQAGERSGLLCCYVFKWMRLSRGGSWKQLTLSRSRSRPRSRSPLPTQSHPHPNRQFDIPSFNPLHYYKQSRPVWCRYCQRRRIDVNN